MSNSAGQPQAPNTLEAAWRIHSYLGENIRFADTKAGALVAWSGGLIGVLFALKSHWWFLKSEFVPTEAVSVKVTLLAVTAVVAFAALAASAGFAFWCVMPRLWSREGAKGHTPGLVFWENIRQHADAARYCDALLAAVHGDTLSGAVSDQIFVLAGITRTKYARLRYGVYFAVAGTVLAVVLALFGAPPWTAD